MSRNKLRKAGPGRKAKPKQCAFCGRIRPGDMYDEPRHKVCRTCVAAGHVDPRWEWVDAHKMELKKRISHLIKHDPYAIFSQELDDVNVFRAIFCLQEKKCVRTSVLFKVPAEGKIPYRHTFEGYINRYKHTQHKFVDCLPYLVRITPENGWRIGNVVFVARAYMLGHEFLTRQIGDLPVSLQRVSYVPQKKQIQDVQQKIVARQLKGNFSI